MTNIEKINLLKHIFEFNTFILNSDSDRYYMKGGDPSLNLSVKVIEQLKAYGILYDRFVVENVGDQIANWEHYLSHDVIDLLTRYNHNVDVDFYELSRYRRNKLLKSIL